MKNHLISLFLLTIFCSTGQAAVPNQWIAKLYSEVLGRVPDQGGWASHTGSYPNGSCGTRQLQNTARAFLKSSEFLGKPYDLNAKLLVAYRALYGQELPTNNLGYLSRWYTWPQIVNILVAIPAFTSLTRSLCANTLMGWTGVYPPNTNLRSGGGIAYSQGGQLQGAINTLSANGGGTIQLQQKSVVTLSAPLILRSNVTLKTFGSPTAKSYANMARIVPSSTFSFTGTHGELIELKSNTRLLNIWVDGQRHNTANFIHDRINVHVHSGKNIEISNNKFADSAGWSTVQVWGFAEIGSACSNVQILSNLITAYSSGHYRYNGTNVWTDGLSISCEDAYIRYNTVIDATDVGIVLFKSGGTPQRSLVLSNTVVNVGNGAYGGLVIDPLLGTTNYDFSGSSVSYNTVWTSTTAHMDVVLSMGTKPWFGDSVARGRNAKMAYNTTGSGIARGSIGIAVNSMSGANVRGNNLRLRLYNSSPQGISCPVQNIVVENILGSNSIQGPYTLNQFNTNSCVGH